MYPGLKLGDFILTHMRLLKNAYEQNLASTYRLAACHRFLFIFLIPDPWDASTYANKPRIRDQLLSCSGRHDTGDYIPYRIPSVYLYYSGLIPTVTTSDPRS